MIADVEQAIIEYGEAGYNCFEIPDFAGDEPIIVAYHPERFRSDAVIGAIMHMPELFGNDDERIYWEDGMARVEAFELSLQGHDAKYIEVHVMGLSDWSLVMQAVAIDEGEADFGYADMFDVVKLELEDMGLIARLY